MCVCLHACVCLCVSVCVCACIHVCVCVCVSCLLGLYNILIVICASVKKQNKKHPSHCPSALHVYQFGCLTLLKPLPPPPTPHPHPLPSSVALVPGTGIWMLNFVLLMAANTSSRYSVIFCAKIIKIMQPTPKPQGCAELPPYITGRVANCKD